jgi:regulator of protease activity HflC (stomatin/prohibitin superfamily)
MPFFFFAFIIILMFLLSFINILKEYERGVIFTLGRFWKVKGPGLIIVIRGLQEMIRVDLRTVVMDVPTQDIITKDNVTTKVNAVVYFRVMDPRNAVIQVENYYDATSQLAQTSLRAILGQHDLDQILSERDKLNHEMQKTLDDQTDPWGVKVTAVEIKDVDLDETMVRAMAKQAEAERTRRAKVILAEGEHQAAEKIRQAADVLATQPQAIQLRYLQTVSEITDHKSSTILFPIPMSFMEGFQQVVSAATGKKKVEKKKSEE